MSINNPIATLPDEIFLHILSFLEKKDLIIISEVDKKCKKFSEDVSLWSVHSKESLKKLIVNKKIIKSEEELLFRIQNFCAKVPLSCLSESWVGKFSCFSLFNSNCEISIQIEPRWDAPRDAPKKKSFEESWIFAKQATDRNNIRKYKKTKTDRCETYILTMVLPAAKDESNKALENKIVSILNNHENLYKARENQEMMTFYKACLVGNVALAAFLWYFKPFG